MADTNINKNLEQDVGNSLDVSKNSDQQQTSLRQEDKREWGPGTPKYYMDTMASYMPPVQSQETQVVEQQQAPGRMASLKEFAQKVKKALNLDKDEKLVEEEAQEEVEETQAKEKDLAKHTENLVKSMSDTISEIKKEAKEEVAQTNDPMTRMVVDLTDQLEKELQKETLDWNKIDLLVRQIAILLVQKSANNDQVTIQEEIKMMQQDVQNVRDTYNTKWELALGITMGVISIAGGLAGAGAGIGGLAGAVSQGALKTVEQITMGTNLLSKGGESFQGFLSKSSESKRQLYNYELERDRSHKQTTESSLQGNKSTKGSQMSQRDRAIESAYRAFVQLAQ